MVKCQPQHEVVHKLETSSLELCGYKCAHTDGSRKQQLLVHKQLFVTMPSPALRPVQASCCWALPLSPLLFHAPELSNDLLSNHLRGKLLTMLALAALHAT